MLHLHCVLEKVCDKMLWETLFHHVLGKVVLHKHHQKHQCIRCKFCWGWGNVKWVPGQYHLLDVQRLLYVQMSHSNFTCCLVSKVSSFAILANSLIKFPVVAYKSKESSECLGILGGFMCWIACVLEGSGRMPVVLRM